MQDGGGAASQTSSGTMLNLNDIALGFLNTVANNAASRIVPPGDRVTSTTNTAPIPQASAMAASWVNTAPMGIPMPVIVAGATVLTVLGIFLVARK